MGTEWGIPSAWIRAGRSAKQQPRAGTRDCPHSKASPQSVPLLRDTQQKPRKAKATPC